LHFQRTTKESEIKFTYISP